MSLYGFILSLYDLYGFMMWRKHLLARASTCRHMPAHATGEIL